jgi:hypothetical protein
VSLSKQAEVREKVLRYMPVMSRPFVLLGERPISWTPIYANLEVSFNFAAKQYVSRNMNLFVSDFPSCLLH